MHWLWHLLGFDYGLPYGRVGFYNAWSGFGSDLDDAADQRDLAEFGRRAARRHREKTAQDALHHAERLTQADRHQAEATALAEKHHRQRLDQAAAHHEALKAHITAAAAAPAKPATTRKGSTHG